MERNSETSIPKRVNKLIKELNKLDINYCHWKSNEHLYEGLIGKTDLDILVSKKDYKKFIKVLEDNEYCRVVSNKWQKYPDVEDWIGLDTETGLQTHIHLHMKLITGKTYVKEQLLPYDDIVLDNRVKSKYGMYICNPNIEIIILLMRSLLKRPDYIVIPNNKKDYCFPKSIRVEYEYLKNRIKESDVDCYLEKMVDHQTSALIKDILWYGATNKKMRKLKKCISRLLKNYRIKLRFIVLVQSFYRYYFIKVLQKMKININLKKKIYKGGLAVAFLGVDGSGKSTIAKQVYKNLKWKIDCRYLYMGTGDGSKNLVNNLMRRHSGNKKGLNKPNKTVDGTVNKKVPKGLKLLLINYNHYLNAKYKYKQVRRMDRFRKNGCLLIMDRFPQLQYFGINDGPQIMFLGNGLGFLINKCFKNKETKYFKKISNSEPDVIIKLKISFETSRSRKQDSSEETIRRKIDIVDHLHFKKAKEYIVVNEGNAESAIIKSQNIIWENINKY